MDSKPFRPSRPRAGGSFIAPTNENMAPAAYTLHQRHKSAGNLLSMASTGGLKVAAKRSAFADVSNLSKVAAVYDAAKNAAKPQPAVSILNSLSLTHDQENVPSSNEAFLRPAHRPPTKVQSSYPSSSALSTASAIAESMAEPIGKIAAPRKSATLIFRDGPIEEEEEQSHAASEAVSAVPVALSARRPRHHQSQPALQLSAATAKLLQESSKDASSRQDIRAVEEKPVSDHISWDKATWEAVMAAKDTQLRDSEAISQSANQDVVEPSRMTSTILPQSENNIELHDTYQPQLYHDAEDTPVEGWETHKPYSNLIEESIEEPWVDARETLVEEEARATDYPGWVSVEPQETKAAPVATEPIDIPQIQPTYDGPADPLPPAALEEFAELSDYEEEEYYDDQGYTTAHSYRSRGDNTTGGVTTVMFPPRLSKRGVVELETAKELVESTRTDEEIEEESWDISMVAEYGEEIFQYMKELEMQLLPNPHYMDNQTEIQWSMRAVLMDWVIQVHTRFGLLPETLFLTVNYIDRFLSNKVVSVGKLQLVGATAIFVAAKYEEINCPSIQEIVYMVEGGYSMDEILKAERFMLSMLQFELGWPGPMSFLRRISKADDYDLETRTLAKYFLEVIVMDERFVASPPSYIAAGSHCLSRLLLAKGDWTPAHVHYSGYTYQQLKPLIGMMLDCCRIARKHHNAVFEKYADKRYKRASTYVEAELSKGFRLPFQRTLSYPPPMDCFDEYIERDSYTTTNALKMPIPIEG